MHDETERPSIEFEGRRYVRRNGAWVDERAHIKANVNVSQRIDTSARKDSSFWERCCNQDFDDDPKNRGRLRIKLPVGFFGGSLDDAAGTNPAPRPTGGSKRRARVGENVKMSFKNRGRDLVVRCDIEPGWHETTSGWVFQESDRLELPSGHPLRASAKFAEHTFGQWGRRTSFGAEPSEVRLADTASLDETVPTFGSAEYELTNGIRLLLDGTVATFSIELLDAAGELNDALPWKQVKRDWVVKSYESGVYEVPIRMRESRSSLARPFYIEIEVVLHEPPHPEHPPEYAERTRFASGGLPSLGKRR